MPEKPQGEIVRFADVQRTVGASNDVDEPHRDDDAIVATAIQSGGIEI